MSKVRNTDEVLNDIKVLVRTNGYIYSLLLILFEDFHVDPENLHQMDNYSRINMNEASLLIGYLSQENIDLAIPNSMDQLFEAKKKTYDLLEELHQSFHKPFIEELVKRIQSGPSTSTSTSQDFFKNFNKGSMIAEPIFYSGTGVYDFQYLESLSKKYHHDQEWLQNNRKYVFKEIVDICTLLKKYLQEKSEKVHLKFMKDHPDLKEKARESYTGKNFEKDFQELKQMAELHQYSDLFWDDSLESLEVGSEDFRKASHQVFFKNLIELFTIPRSELLEQPGGQFFIENFSLETGSQLAKNYAGLGAYNPTQSHPLLVLDQERFLLPLSFFIAESVYDSPYYWMIQDKKYASIASTNRGNVGEDISFQFLNKIYGNNTFRRVAVKSSKNSDALTDIDILCVLGSKAICVQVKSKKLTEQAKKGNDEALRKDFKGAVQDAYEQAWISRQKILDQSSKFFDENNDEITLSEGIDEVYMVVVTTEHYPAVSHQTRSFIQLKDDSPYPLAMSVFDLELVAHYLTDPYEFLYYIRQRIQLMDYFHGDEEMSYLGYHLTKKLWKHEEADFVGLDNTQAQIIDRNYFPFKAGIEVSDDGDSIKSAWKNEKFDSFLKQIKSVPEEKITDVIFHLYDLSSEMRSKLVNMIMESKTKTWRDGKHHDFACFFSTEDGPSFGITYFSSETDSLDEVKNRLSVLCSVRKYTSKSRTWLGLGSIKSSRSAFDLLIYMDSAWEYDEALEEKSKHFADLSKLKEKFEPNPMPQYQTTKTGRNDPCPCGSGKKYKKCHLNA